jgi:hypothetical protein
MKENKRVFIVIKTYPTISKKYAELVCTAGVLEDGSWIRLYPISFRKLDIDQQYPKYAWINLVVERNYADFRPETYRPIDLSKIVVEPKPQKANWDEWRKIIFKNKKIYTNLDELISCAKKDGTSLAIFKPTEVLDFTVEKTDRDWDPDKLSILKAQSQQITFFETPEQIEKEFQVVKKVPYKFKYRFKDDSGKESTMMIEDWEIGMLYFNCLKRAGNDEKTAIAKVKEKYFNQFCQRDLHLFLGTAKAFHNIAPNPFMIVGVFYPLIPSPYQQMSLLN